jgi:O-antigen ligase
MVAILLVCVAALVTWFPSAIRTAEPYALRGTAEQASTLSSRLNWWSASIPVWRESPWVGKGLLTATRFQVLNKLGLSTTSSIHSTWVEALVGTGVVGMALLAAAILTALARAARRAFRKPPDALPLLIILVLLVRSLTSSEMSSMSIEMVLFLWLAMSMRERVERWRETPDRVTVLG